MIRRVKLSDTQSLAGVLGVVDGYIQYEIDVSAHPTPAMCQLLLLKALVLQLDQGLNMANAALDLLARRDEPVALPEAVEAEKPAPKGRVKK